MPSRLLAVVAAVGMIAGAFVYRYGMPGGDGTGGRAGDGAQGSTLYCAAELGPVCDEVRGATAEPAADTLEKLIAARDAGDADLAGWIAPGPWPEMVDEGRRLSSRPPLFSKESQALASTTLVAVVRAGEVPAGCTEVTWRCLGDAAQDPRFRIGADRASRPTGLFLRAAALGGFFGNADYASNDLDEQPEARSWLDNLNNRLAAAPSFGARSLNSFVLQQGSAQVYLTTAAEAAGLRGDPRFEVESPAPVVRVVTRFTPAARNGGRIDAGAVREVLAAAGWDEAKSGAETDGLPSPGVLLALLEER